MTLKRLSPERPFPRYIFVPGVHPHPKKEGGHMEGEKDPVSDRIDETHPEANENFRFAIDLYNFGYFWESHVYFESLWNAHRRTGATSDLLKAFIKLGAAGVKFSLGEEERAREHFDRARELLTLVMKEKSPVFLGIDLVLLIKQIEQGQSIRIIPLWE